MKKPSPLATPDPISPFLTVEEVAAVLRIGRMRVYRLIHSGHLPALKVGRDWRFTREGLTHYLERAQTAGGNPTKPIAIPTDPVMDEAPEDWETDLTHPLSDDEDEDSPL